MAEFEIRFWLYRGIVGYLIFHKLSCCHIDRFSVIKIAYTSDIVKLVEIVKDMDLRLVFGFFMILWLYLCDASLRADAGRRADDRELNLCAPDWGPGSTKQGRLCPIFSEIRQVDP